MGPTNYHEGGGGGGGGDVCVVRSTVDVKRSQRLIAKFSAFRPSVCSLHYN